MSDKLDDEVLNKIAKSFQNCKEQCEFHKQFNELKNKDEVFEALKVVLKVFKYHETENEKILPPIKASLLMFLNIFSTQYSLIDILDWYMNTVNEIEKQKKWIN